MEKVVVSIVEIERIDQLLALPPRYIYNNRLWLINHISSSVPAFFVKDNRMLFAHDMMIKPRWGVMNQSPFDHHRKIWYLDRFDKINQNVHLETTMAMFDTRYYFNLPVSEINFNTRKVTYHHDSSRSKYVIKPTGGARSLGILFIDQPINLRELLTEMHKLIRDTNTINEQYFELWTKFGLRWHAGEEVRDNDLAKTIAENTLVIQEMNPFDDVIEFRAISGTAEPLFFKRNHLHDDKMNVLDEFIEVGGIIDPDVYKEIKMVIASGKIQTYGSHDIWYSPSAKKWGIYEYQNQYGHVHIPAEEHLEYLKAVLDNAYHQLNINVVSN